MKWQSEYERSVKRMLWRTFLSALFVWSVFALRGSAQPPAAVQKPASQELRQDRRAALIDPVSAALAVVPNTRRTSGNIPLFLRIHNNTDKSIRLLNLFSQNKLPIVVHFDLIGPNIGPSGSGLDYQEKAELCRWDYVYIKVKPHHTFQARFDLALMTLDKRLIPPGKYTLSGLYGANEGYPSNMGSGDDVFNGCIIITPIDLTVDQ